MADQLIVWLVQSIYQFIHLLRYELPSHSSPSSQCSYCLTQQHLKEPWSPVSKNLRLTGYFCNVSPSIHILALSSFHMNVPSIRKMNLMDLYSRGEGGFWSRNLQPMRKFQMVELLLFEYTFALFEQGTLKCIQHLDHHHNWGDMIELQFWLYWQGFFRQLLTLNMP